MSSGTTYSIEVDGEMVPDIRFASGRIAYGTKGQHEQCQPRIQPDKLAEARRGFFSETLYRKRDKEEVAKEVDPLT